MPHDDGRPEVAAAQIASVDGRAESFDAVFAAEKKRLYGLAWTILRDRHEAEDAVQETMWQAWRHWSSLREESKRASWLTTICIRHCFRSRRRLLRSLPGGAEVESAADVPETGTRGRVGAAGGTSEQPRDPDLELAFGRLSRSQRAAILLHHRMGYTVDQCAELMGCAPGTVRTHLQRGLASLRVQLSDGGDG